MGGWQVLFGWFVDADIITGNGFIGAPTTTNTNILDVLICEFFFCFSNGNIKYYWSMVKNENDLFVIDFLAGRL